MPCLTPAQSVVAESADLKYARYRRSGCVINWTALADLISLLDGGDSVSCSGGTVSPVSASRGLSRVQDRVPGPARPGHEPADPASPGEGAVRDWVADDWCRRRRRRVADDSVASPSTPAYDARQDGCRRPVPLCPGGFASIGEVDMCQRWRATGHRSYARCYIAFPAFPFARRMSLIVSRRKNSAG